MFSSLDELQDTVIQSSTSKLMCGAYNGGGYFLDQCIHGFSENWGSKRKPSWPPTHTRWHTGHGNGIFQQDNFQVHMILKTWQFLQENGIILLHWTPFSPDMSPSRTHGVACNWSCRSLLKPNENSYELDQSHSPKNSEWTDGGSRLSKSTLGSTVLEHFSLLKAGTRTD